MTQEKSYPYQDFLLRDLEGEKWDEIQYLNGAYLLSNFGKIKRLGRWVKVGNRMVWFPEKILRSHLSKQNGAKRAKELAYLIGSATLEKR